MRHPRELAPGIQCAEEVRRLSSAMMHGADPAGQDLVSDVREPSALEPAREGVRFGKIEHRLWQVGIGVLCFDTARPIAGRMRRK